MDRTTVWFIRMSLIYLLVGAVTGVLMLTAPRYIVYYLPVHSHIMVFGWVTMLIFGVGYHILPRFSGQQIWSQGLFRATFWLANVGVIGMAVFWAFFRRNPESAAMASLLGVFGIIAFVGILCFIINMLKTIKPAEGIQPPAR